jgi:hypothetical protein
LNQLPLERSQSPPQPKTPRKKTRKQKGTKPKEKKNSNTKTRKKDQGSKKQPKDMTSPNATQNSRHATMHKEDTKREVKACNMILNKMAKSLG